MQEVRLARLHGVLVRPELRQPFDDKALEQRERVAPCDRQREAIDGAPASLPARDLRHHVAGEGVGFDEQTRRRGTRLGPRLAIVGVEVPGATARGAVGLHQHAVGAAQLAIEPLHAQFLAALRPVFEHGAWRNEARIFAALERDAECGEAWGDAAQLLEQLPLPRFRADDATCAVLARGVHDRVLVRGSHAMVHHVTGCTQPGGEVAQRTEDQHQLLPMPRQFGALGHRLDEEHDHIGAGCTRNARHGAGALPWCDEGDGRSGGTCHVEVHAVS